MDTNRIAARYLVGKAVSLLPDFKKAMEAYNKQDVGPITDLLERVIKIIIPGTPTGPSKPGGAATGLVPAPWFMALGPAKQNQLDLLQKVARRLLEELPTIKDLPPKDQRWEYHRDILYAMQKNLRTLELATRAEEEDRVVQRGGFSIIPMPGVKKEETDAALETLDAAATKIRSKFPMVLYGNIYFSTQLRKAAGSYVYATDVINLNVRARKRFDDIYTLIHEFGHRYDHKFMSKEVRKKLWTLSSGKEFVTIHYDAKLRDTVADEAVGIAKSRKDGKPFHGMTPELEQWAKIRDLKKGISEFLAGRLSEKELHAAIKGPKDVEVKTDKVLHGPLAVTPYGATSPAENIADAFAHFVLDMSMPAQIQEVFASL